MEPGTKLPKGEEASPQHTNLPYQELVESLMYLAVCTRLDIAHTVSFLSQYNHRYDSSHWAVAKRVLRYLKGSPNLGTNFRKDATGPLGFVDADWANCITDRRSYTGFTFILAGGPVRNHANNGPRHYPSPRQSTWHSARPRRKPYTFETH